MAIGKDKTLLQVIVSKNTMEFVTKYCSMFGISYSQFCNLAICEKVLSLLNMEVKDEKTQENTQTKTKS